MEPYPRNDLDTKPYFSPLNYFTGVSAIGSLIAGSCADENEANDRIRSFSSGVNLVDFIDDLCSDRYVEGFEVPEGMEEQAPIPGLCVLGFDTAAMIEGIIADLRDPEENNRYSFNAAYEWPNEIGPLVASPKLIHYLVREGVNASIQFLRLQAADAKEPLALRPMFNDPRNLAFLMMLEDSGHDDAPESVIADLMICHGAGWDLAQCLQRKGGCDAS